MRLCLVGVNHNTAPLAVREKVAIRAGKLEEALAELRAGIPRGVILSTCNRTEIYAVDTGDHPAEKAGLEFLKAQAGAAEDSLRQYLYTAWDREAPRPASAGTRFRSARWPWTWLRASSAT
jgi:glutamyl-tRNA reductase